MRRPWARRALHQRLIVNLKSGKAISGVLWDERDGVLVLRDGALHEAGGPDGGAALDGDVLLERADVDFAQALPPRVPGPSTS